MIRKAVWTDAMHITLMWAKMHHEITDRKALLAENSDGKELFKQVLSRVDDPNWIILVAEEEGVIGFIMSKIHWPLYSKVHIIGSCEALYVEEEFRGNGVFNSLINESRNIAEDMGAREFEFICSYDKKYVDFYDKLGYEPVQIVLRQKEV